MLTPDSIRGILGIKKLNEPILYKIYFTGKKEGYGSTTKQLEVGVNKASPLFKILESLKSEKNDEEKTQIALELSKLGFKEIDLGSIKTENIEGLNHSVEDELNINTSNISRKIN
jgi:hypothetical protein